MEKRVKELEEKVRRLEERLKEWEEKYRAILEDEYQNRLLFTFRSEEEAAEIIKEGDGEKENIEAKTKTGERQGVPLDCYIKNN